MRAEIAKLHQRLNTTTIYVTHDQTEAMTMATRIVVMKDGVIQQVGSPKEVYDNPENVFVGGFIGSPAMNFFKAKIEGEYVVLDEKVRLKIPGGKLKLLKDNGYVGKEVIFGIRPEDIHDEPVFIESFPDDVIEVNIEVAELTGAELMLYSSLAGHDFVARIDARNQIKAGDKVKLGLDLNKAHFFDTETELRIK